MLRTANESRATESMSLGNPEMGLSRWRAAASPILIILHLLGLTMFLGSILGNIVLSLGAPATGDPHAVVFAWRAIGVANTFLTVPGLLLTVASGLLLIPTQGRNPRYERWLVLKILAVIGIIVVATTLIEPSEEQLRQLATGLPDLGARAVFMDVAIRQQMYGAINLALVVLASVLGVFKPRLGGKTPRRLRR
jgi:uncharacterized membrane protein